ncbi:hypothetical protein DdX_05328 [Ditylenchus destructor]|uniref:Uncharacterized protein n=1 Tax=Ditylenchus destructor TaxID=166010 RepID=A0AAD4R9R0_9BILA|nr:hypothetical protein DdX_05328 [Ditylenchus destructor]
MAEDDVTIKFKWNHCGKNYRFQMKVKEHDAFWDAIFAFVPDFNDSLSYTDVNGDQVSLSAEEGLLKLIDLYMDLKPKYVTIRTVPKLNEAQESEDEETNVSTTTYQETIGRNECNVQARESESTIDQLPTNSNDWKPDKNAEEYGKISDYLSRLNLSNNTPPKRIDLEEKYAPNPPIVPQYLPKSSPSVNSENNAVTRTIIPTDAGKVEGKCDFAILEKQKDPNKKELAEYIFRCACVFGAFRVSFHDHTGKLVFEHAIDERIARTLTWHNKRIIYAAANAVAQNMPQTLSIKFLEDRDFDSFLAFFSQATSFSRA